MRAISGWLRVGILTAGLAMAAAAGAEDGPRVVVLGFDGADARLTEQLMDEGALPHLARLRETGTFSPLGTTVPPQTPVSWSSFATGRNPGGTGIFDFLRRDLATYQPDFAMYRISNDPVGWGKNNHLLIALALLTLALIVGPVIGLFVKRPVRGLAVGLVAGVVLGLAGFVFGRDLIPYRVPHVENTRQGATFWEVAGEAGIPATIVRVPGMFPPDPFAHGSILAGLGVPDIRGNFGTFTYYTTESRTEQVDENTEFGGKIIQVSLLDGACESYIYGPRNRLFDDPPDILTPVRFRVDREASPHTVTVTTDTANLTVALGEWSDWVTLEFPFSPIVKGYGLARFNFVSSEPFGLYMSAINLDPHRPALPVSAPGEFSGQLADRFGPYKTLGWAMDTWALNELTIDEETFLEDVYFTEGKFAEMMRGLLQDRNDRLFVQVFGLTDRVGHMFWRFFDPEHPAYDAELAVEYGDAVRDAYVYMDDLVGEALELMEPDDVLFVASDHGFHTWHKSVNYNTWLVRNGYMTLRDDSADRTKTLEDLFGQGEFWPNVDWGRTKAYALGLGDLYINVQGREAEGIVEPGDEYERIRRQLITDLQGWVDPETGEHPVRRVITREDAYGDFDPDLIPDLMVANNPKYRVSWQTSLGGIPRDLFTINDRKWSGDHCSLDPEITKGIFFSNRRLDAAGVSILDFYPTILGYLGVDAAADIDGRRIPER